MIVINALANILPINGMTTSEISNLYQVLFTPAGYVFSIWGIIYLSLLFWLIWISFKKSFLSKATASLFVLSCILNGCWILLWQYQFVGLSVLVIVSFLITLIYIYLKEKRNSVSVIPFSIYLGWVTIATLANSSYYLVSKQGISMLTQVVTASLFLVIGILIGSGILIVFKDWVFNLVFIWAYLGIFIRVQSMNLVVALISLAGSLILTALLVIFALKKEWKKTSK